MCKIVPAIRNRIIRGSGKEAKIRNLPEHFHALNIWTLNVKDTLIEAC